MCARNFRRVAREQRAERELGAVRLDFLLEPELRLVEVAAPPRFGAAGALLLAEVHGFVRDQVGRQLRRRRRVDGVAVGEDGARAGVQPRLDLRVVRREALDDLHAAVTSQTPFQGESDLAQLHGSQKSRRLPRSLVPPRPSGMTCSIVSGPSDPHRKHWSPSRSTSARRRRRRSRLFILPCALLIADSEACCPVEQRVGHQHRAEPLDLLRRVAELLERASQRDQAGAGTA
jgi:hypothetical protein